MKSWRLTLFAAVAACGLAACDVQQPETRVTTPQASLPDDAALRAPGTPPVAATPAPATTAPTAASTPAPDPTAPQVATTPAADPNAPPAPTSPAVDAQTASSPTSAMGGPPAPSADPAAPPSAAAAPGAPAAGGQGSAAQTEMWQAYPPGAPASASAGSAKVSQNSLPAVRNPGDPEGAKLLAQRSLEVPVVGIQPTSLSDMYEQSRGSRRHEAIDILARTGTPVVAVDDGRIAKLFPSRAGGLTVYQFDPEARLAYYYAHLHDYAPGLREGMDVKRGNLIGYVGATGNADASTPHLHFAVFRLGTPPKWWEGEPINPYPALSRAQPAQQLASR
jgi:murein DD-endopeptidase MepM/ murein hydrolase activator NlpD